ncbi:MAG: hypothetical protein ACFFG0_41510, partial [Candidatus Thorarchaeota archaeon]
MKEYDNGEFKREENELENKFEPNDEEKDVKEDFIDFFPKDEQESNIEIFEVNFKLKNEMRNEKVQIEDNFTPNDEKNTQKLREIIRNIDWDEITTDWNIELRINQYPAQEIQLNPKQDCSRINPLYKHKIWLETIYANKKLNLTDKQISKICGVHLTTIQNWRKIHDIPTKDWANGKWVEERGYVKILMPKGYLHPELVPNKGRNVRFEHVIVMENFLSRHPELEWSKKCLIDGKYLKLGTVVHHINFKKYDNRLENLWLYENIETHKKVESTLNECFRDLIKLNQIEFKDGNYYLNTNLDCRVLTSSKIKEILI